MHAIIVLGILAIMVTALRWMAAQEKAAQSRIEADGK